MAYWVNCTACETTGEELCIECLGVGEDPDEDGTICTWCLGDGVTQCGKCTGEQGWYAE